MMQACVDRVVGAVKLLNGDVYGDFLRDHMVGEEPMAAGLKIKCRLRTVQEKYLIGFLMMMDYFVARESFNKLVVRSKTLSGAAVVLEVNSTQERKDFFAQTIEDFDVNCLVADEVGTFVRPIPVMHYVSDKVSYVMRRIREKRFCLVRIPFLPFDVRNTMIAATELVRRGWSMDDRLFGGASWVVFAWKTTPSEDRPDPKIRTEDHSNAIVQTHDVCAICQEKFKPNETVVNLSCNHNFHVFCNCGTSASLQDQDLFSEANASRPGLAAWLATNNATCPYCRNKT